MTVRTRWVGAALVGAIVSFQSAWIGAPSLLLSVALVASYLTWIGTPWSVTPRLRIAFLIAVGVFIGHAIEEFLTGLHIDLPALFGLAPLSDLRFLVFIGVWTLIFLAAALTTTPSRSLPVLIILFFAIAGGVLNGVLHPLLAARQGSYFPGLFTAPLMLVTGLWLLWLLYAPRNDRSCARV